MLFFVALIVIAYQQSCGFLLIAILNTMVMESRLLNY